MLLSRKGEVVWGALRFWLSQVPSCFGIVQRRKARGGLVNWCIAVAWLGAGRLVAVRLCQVYWGYSFVWLSTVT